MIWTFLRLSYTPSSSLLYAQTLKLYVAKTTEVPMPESCTRRIVHIQKYGIFINMYMSMPLITYCNKSLIKHNTNSPKPHHAYAIKNDVIMVLKSASPSLIAILISDPEDELGFHVS